VYNAAQWENDLLRFAKLYRGLTMKYLLSIGLALVLSVGMASVQGFVVGGGTSSASSTTDSSSGTGGGFAHIGYATNESLSFQSSDTTVVAVAGGAGPLAGGFGTTESNTAGGSTSTSFDAQLGFGGGGASGSGSSTGDATGGFVFVGF
jgi:hypothetical protein